MLALSSSLISRLRSAEPDCDQLAPVAGQFAQLADRPRRDEALGDQAVTGQFADPVAVLHVGLAARHVLDVVRVADDHLEAALQHRIDRPPVDAGALHRDQRAAAARSQSRSSPVPARRAESAGLLAGLGFAAPTFRQATTVAWCTSRLAQHSTMASINSPCKGRKVRPLRRAIKSDSTMRAPRCRGRQRAIPFKAARIKLRDGDGNTTGELYDLQRSQRHSGVVRPAPLLPLDTAPPFSAMGVRPRPLANSVLNACSSTNRTGRRAEPSANAIALCRRTCSLLLSARPA